MQDNFYEDRIKRRGENSQLELKKIGNDFMLESFDRSYSYNFDWLSLPIIQYPEDIVRLQEIIWLQQPDCIVETGIARGGSLIFSASMLALMDARDHCEGKSIKPRSVIGIDIDIRDHNRSRIENHFLSKKITMVQGSSVDAGIFGKVLKLIEGYTNILVLLDSNHSESHVLEELNIYSELIKVGGHLVVYDTVCELLGDKIPAEKGWGRGNNPHTAVEKFLKKNDSFILDEGLNNSAVISTCASGYLKRIK